jgi:hypothetical protein
MESIVIALEYMWSWLYDPGQRIFTYPVISDSVISEYVTPAMVPVVPDEALTRIPRVESQHPFTCLLSNA